jgi:hypothetical protein
MVKNSGMVIEKPGMKSINHKGTQSPDSYREHKGH